MKRIMFWVIAGLFFTSIVTSCGTTQSSCDAYGDNLNIQSDQSDLANNK